MWRVDANSLHLGLWGYMHFHVWWLSYKSREMEQSCWWCNHRSTKSLINPHLSRLTTFCVGFVTKLDDNSFTLVNFLAWNSGEEKMTSLKQNSTHIRTRLAWQKTYPFGFKIQIPIFLWIHSSSTFTIFLEPYCPQFFSRFFGTLISISLSSISSKMVCLWPNILFVNSYISTDMHG